MFEQQFSLFKQYNTYFYNIFSSTYIFTILKQHYWNNVIKWVLILPIPQVRENFIYFLLPSRTHKHCYHNRTGPVCSTGLSGKARLVFLTGLELEKYIIICCFGKIHPMQKLTFSSWLFVFMLYFFLKFNVVQPNFMITYSSIYNQNIFLIIIFKLLDI